MKYVRYADDVIIHCASQSQAERLLKSIQERMQSVGLELHPQKTKILYCKDFRRQGKYPTVKFDCAISISSRKRIADKLGDMKVEKLSFKSIVGIAQYLNPMIRGWINYYGKFIRSELHKVFRLLTNRLLRWARKRYKRYKTSLVKANKWYKRIRKQFPNLFYHWQVGS